MRALKISGKEYLYFNITAVLCIILIIITLYAFSLAENQQFITCSHKAIFGKPCITCGSTRAFGYIFKGQFSLAEKFNYFAIKLFWLLIIQLILRTIFIIDCYSNWLNIKYLIIIDILFSLVLFCNTFYEVIVNTLKLFYFMLIN
jgi:hypothetical protein